MIQTANFITFTANVQLIPLGTAFVAPALTAISSGWGPRTQLHTLTVNTISNADCRSRMTANWHPFIYEHTLCVLTNAGQAICENGNPLVINNQIVGIAAWDFNCQGSHPSMHERVAHFHPWIVSTAV